MGILPDWMIDRDVKIEPRFTGEKRQGVISYGTSSYGYDARLGYKFRHFRPNLRQTVVDPKNFDPAAYNEIDLIVNCLRCDGLGEIIYDNGVARPAYPHTSPHHRMQCAMCKGNGFTQTADHIVIPPHSFVLGETFETYDLPRDCLCIVVGKSTYARCGIIVNVTPGEPEWVGKWTIEISNTNPLPAKVYAGEGICQLLFIRTDGHNEAVLNAVRRLCGQGLQDSLNGEKHFVLNAAPQLRTIEELLHKELGNGTCRISYKDKKGKYQDQTGMTSPIVDGK